jgi:hypothetical protein
MDTIRGFSEKIIFVQNSTFWEMKKTFPASEPVKIS